MMKKLFLCLIMLFFTVTAEAVALEEHPEVAVMDFGTHAKDATHDVGLVNAEQAATDYIIASLVQNGRFILQERYIHQSEIDAENLNTVGLIDPDTAKRLGEILGVRYLIYGNVTDVGVGDVGASSDNDDDISGAMTVITVKAHITTRIMDTTTGNIIMAASGEGKSRSSRVKVAKGDVAIAVGRYKVSQDSVYSALRKAADNSVSILEERLYGKKK